jgi:Tat protein secretion system quality control protein TatD with DNase activity
VKTLPVERILIESDYDGKKDIPHLPSIAEKISALLNIPIKDMLKKIEENANAFIA